MRKRPNNEVPNICDGIFDVITNIRREIFIFKDEAGSNCSNFPIHFHNLRESIIF